MLDGPMKFGVGVRMTRMEDERFLKGEGQYVDDLTFEGQLHAYVLRSPYGHAAMTVLDTSAALEAPGVQLILTHADLETAGMQPLIDISGLKNADGTAIAPVAEPQLAKDRVRYVGQPIAFVVAESREQARDAAELIDVDFDELPVVVEPIAALAEGAPQLHADAPGNLAYDWEIGGKEAADAAFAAAAHITKLNMKNQRIIVNAMEPRAINALWDTEAEQWDIHTVSQGVTAMRRQLARQLGVDQEKLRVRTPDVGGGFGMKLMNHPEYPVAALAAQRLGKPVKWTADRTESFLSDVQARELVTEAELALDADAKIIGIRVQSMSNLGAHYSQVGAAIHAMFSAGLYGTIYRVPAMHARVRGVFTNTTPTDAYRGAGRPEANYVTERLIDRAAVEIGMDAAEIRRRNLLTPEDIPFVSPGGLNFDSADCVTHLEIALDHIGYGERESRRAEAKARGKAYGIGVAYYMERTGGGPIENATLKILPTGKAQAAIGTQSNGQGHETAWAQLIHQKLGIDPSCIELIQGDTAVAPPGGGTGGSRSLIMAHRVFFEAADDLIEKGREAAAQKLEAAVADIEFSAAEGGVFRVAGTDKMLDLFQAAEAAEATTGTAELLGIGGVTESTATFPNGAHLVEMEIDLATGEPTVTRYVIVDDFGRVVNPLLVEGQVHGGIAQGLGQALMENGVYDPESGQPLAGSYMDYAMPRAADLPMFETTISEQAPATTNPLGVKGCGEAGSVGAIGAVTLAALDALRPYGVQDLETPLTPSVLWQAIQDSKV